VFFFEKKNQKTFICWSTRKLVNIASGRTAKAQKFFVSFFSKNKSFLAFAAPHPAGAYIFLVFPAFRIVF
jgi:protein associated with RNAse G/E